MDQLRSLFLLRPDIVFLNHGSFGACPLPVFEAYQAWQRELERQPVEFLQRRFATLMQEARERLGAYVGAASDEIVYVPNATTGLNIVARSLTLQPGDHILTTNQEYGALDRTWRFICNRRGAHYIQQSIPLPITSAQEVVEAIWAGVTAHTRVLFISHVTSPTGLILPIAPLIERARAAGIITVVDGAHAPGQIPLDLHALGVDFYAGNCHKWMMSPKGAGFLYARRDMQSLLQPLTVSWGWMSDTPSASRFVDEQEYQGTRDIAAYLSVPEAIRFMEQHQWTEVRKRCHKLVREAARRVEMLTGMAPIAPVTDTWVAQMSALPIPLCNAAVLKQRLYDEFAVEAPIATWRDRQFVRVSIQGYNTASDVDALIAALDQLLPEVKAE
ncbi:MAG: aminotransferase class V-fold PLP-dependent enzyme [Chloroflexales bacterium]|nr:aminotransferase class V-fold PLP-dependent enzyme [Chloroflexales bacterium]